MCISRKIWQEVLTIFDLSIWESSLVNGWLIWWLVPFWPPKKTKESPHLHIRVAQRQHMYTPRGCLPWCRGIPMGFMGKCWWVSIIYIKSQSFCFVYTSPEVGSCEAQVYTEGKHAIHWSWKLQHGDCGAKVLISWRIWEHLQHLTTTCNILAVDYVFGSFF